MEPVEASGRALRRRGLWVLFWQVVGAHPDQNMAQHDGKLEAVLSHNVSERTVRRFMEKIWSSEALTPAEMLSHTAFGTAPYKVEHMYRAHGVPVPGLAMAIGYDPMLYGVKAEEVRKISEYELEVTWRGPRHLADICNQFVRGCPEVGKEPSVHRVTIRAPEGGLYGG
jgi:hypothetical protein